MNKISNLISYLKSKGFLGEALYLMKIAEPITHIVSSGETAGGIASKYNVSLDSLLEANPKYKKYVKFKDGAIVVWPLRLGDKLNIPESYKRLNDIEDFPSERLKEWLKREEGGNGARKDYCKEGAPAPPEGKPFLCAYDDGAGNLTIGFGRKLSPGDPRQINESDAIRYLDEDIAAAAASIKRSVDSMESKNLTIPISLKTYQLDALTSIIFNAGSKNYAQTSLHKNFIRRGIISGGDFEAEFLNTLINEGRTKEGLKKRRQKELVMFLRGEYNN